MQKTIGGDRLGSGSKMKVDLHGYERSTHNLSYLWRSTMAAGTLVPFMSEVALPGDTFDIDLDTEILTHPTVGPLFGSAKVQLDIFQAPIRLYQALLHNNQLGIGLNMANVRLPKLQLTPTEFPTLTEDLDIDNIQINPSCLLSYLGIRGIGNPTTHEDPISRKFNAVPFLAYWEIYKNYYANKQEEIGAVLHTPSVSIVQTVDSIEVFIPPSGGSSVPQAPSGFPQLLILGSMLYINYLITDPAPIPSQIIISTDEHGDISIDALSTGVWTDSGTQLASPFRQTFWGDTTINNWRYITDTDTNTGKPAVATFPLTNIDIMRKSILAAVNTSEFVLNTANLQPYSWIYEQPNGIPNTLSNQEGLALKTYQSDLFNNWIQTDWIDGSNGINQVTAIDTSSGQFTIDTLNLAKKVYDMLNRIAISGGTYDDWLDAVYMNDRYTRCESPMYMGGMIKELIFQEVISNSQSENQPLGTIAGRGRLAQSQKGGKVVVKVDEPSYIIGIISITPRIDYSQGNKWDTWLNTLDDLHKPALDEIGFQELITEQMAWWSTKWDDTEGLWIQNSAGKQPAWLNYMTNVNQVRGNFAMKENEMFMTFNRRYEIDETTEDIKDLTTYIDPSKFNFIFAQTSLDAQNYWAQIAVDIIARRKMSAKIMPNL